MPFFFDSYLIIVLGRNDKSFAATGMDVDVNAVDEEEDAARTTTGGEMTTTTGGVGDEEEDD